MFLELTFYTGCVFLLSWSSWLFLLGSDSASQILYLIAGFSPTLIALLLTFFREDLGGLKKIIRPQGSVKTAWYWYHLSLLGTPLIMVVSLGIHILLGGERPQFLDPQHLVTSLDQWPGVIIVFLYVLVFSALGEEIGWRGYFLPRLLSRKSPFQASLILGLIWACWHLPLFWLPDTIQSQLPLSWFLAQILGSTILYTWIYLRTNKSIVPVILFHASGNASIGLLPILPLDNGGSPRPLWLMVGLLWLIAILVLYLERDLFFSSTPENPPEPS
jgi:membrane protease YdiL (CAAX protease family)